MRKTFAIKLCNAQKVIKLIFSLGFCDKLQFVGEDHLPSVVIFLPRPCLILGEQTFFPKIFNVDSIFFSASKRCLVVLSFTLVRIEREMKK